MTPKLLSIALTCAFLAISANGVAQTTGRGSPTYDPGPAGSPHCDTMSGAARDQCLRDEGAKTEKGIGTPSSSGASDMPRDNPRYGESGSPRCDSMSGAAKDQCIRDEQTKSESSSGASAPERNSAR